MTPDARIEAEARRLCERRGIDVDAFLADLGTWNRAIKEAARNLGVDHD